MLVASLTLLVLIVFIALYYKVKQQSGKQNAGHPRPHQNRKLPTTPHDQDEYELQGTPSGSHMNVTPTTAEDYSEIQSVNGEYLYQREAHAPVRVKSVYVDIMEGD